jgi:hypothetical protein
MCEEKAEMRPKGMIKLDDYYVGKILGKGAFAVVSD